MFGLIRQIVDGEIEELKGYFGSLFWNPLSSRMWLVLVIQPHRKNTSLTGSLLQETYAEPQLSKAQVCLSSATWFTPIILSGSPPYSAFKWGPPASSVVVVGASSNSAWGLHLKKNGAFQGSIGAEFLPLHDGLGPPAKEMLPYMP
jgi:hypothetical protein